MENNNSSKRIHPLVAGAAVSVMLVSLTGVAAMTGLIPSSYSNATTAGATSSSDTAAVGPATAMPPAALAAPASEAPAQQVAPAPQNQGYAPRTAPHRASSGTAYAVAQAPVTCSSCGRVESVHVVKHQAKPSGVGMVAGALLGGVLGNQVGGGNGRKVATVAGAVGGGYAGNEIEKNTRGATTYQVRVRMDNGTVRTFPYAQQPGWNAGDRVRVVNGHLSSHA
ncbi:MAG TPA: glycine zipper 2TM domain-containing protein [Noviherbaspirillum sp.]|uniref:glycine zipper 2TM domain-containing protein n=1 Tax=Noviherbaspirillum sp. TaxID=1926288 RepID=UPI002B496579|nr:glycine zipper 2TM domain-containing protein [Noviherbaspirillum sp.]HJV88253.1 glycine zipper 2TM domain-containing protein [Noviherbaspirillum sp.]